MDNDTLLLISNLDAFTLFIWDAAHLLMPVIGIGLVVFALFSSGSTSNQKLPNKLIFAIFIAGILFLNLPVTLSFFGNTIFGSGQGVNALSYGSSEASASAHAPIVSFVIHVVQIGGLIGIIKAIFLAMKPAEQGGGVLSATKVAFPSSLALNIVLLLEFLASNIGGVIGNAINTVIG